MENEISLLILGLSLTFVPILREFIELKTTTAKFLYGAVLIAISGALLYGGWRKIESDSEETRSARISATREKEQRERLQVDMSDLRRSYSGDSLIHMTFLQELRKRFGIARDSQTNLPFITRIGKLEANANSGANFGNIGGTNNTVNNLGKPPRTIGPESEAKLIKRLAIASGSKIAFVKYNSQEPVQFTNQWINIFKKAGWTITKDEIDLAPSGGIGMALFMNKRAEPKFGLLVYEVLKSSGFRLEVYDKPEYSDQEMKIVVGFQE